MKKELTIFCLLLFIFILLGCGSNKATSVSTNDAALQKSNNSPNKPKKMLVVYYSLSGNTKEMATQIQQRINSDIVEIKTVQPYPKDYSETTKQAKEELSLGFKPELQPMQIDLAQYDIIFIGSPCWWSNISTPVISFLSQNNLSGKTIIPFMTHGGGTVGNSMDTIRNLCPSSTFKEMLAVRGNKVKNSKDNVWLWLQKIGAT